MNASAMKKRPLKKKRENVGKIARDLLLKQDNKAPTANEAMSEQLSEYDKNIYECIAENKKKFQSDFYLIVLTKKERVAKNILRSYFFGRLSCPTPDYDQVVYKYDITKDKISFLWVVPDRETCKHMIKNKHVIPPGEWELLSNVLKYQDGSLFRLAKELNGEEEETDLLRPKKQTQFESADIYKTKEING